MKILILEFSHSQIRPEIPINFEPNITIMTSAQSEHQDAINKVLDVLTSDKDLAVQILDYTKTASMLKMLHQHLKTQVRRILTSMPMKEELWM